MNFLNLRKREILKKIKNNLFLKQKGYNFYFCTYGKNTGNVLLNYYAKKFSLLNNLKILIKDLLYAAYFSEISIYKNKNFNHKYEKIIVTWSEKSQFNKKGSFYDKIIDTQSDKIKNVLWFVIYMDNTLPSKLSKNIILLKPIKNKRFNLLYLIKQFFLIIRKSLLTAQFSIHHFSSYSIFAEGANDYFKKFLHKKVRKIIMPYESQPFQNRFFLTAHEFSKKIKTIGYVHSPPEALPAHVVKKKGDPKKIILNGTDQLYCYTKFLNWKKKDIKILESIRFKKKKESLINQIFLPIVPEKLNKVFNCLKFLHEKKIINLKYYKIRNHPHSKNSKNVMKLESKIKLLKKRTGKIIKDDKLSIFIGATGAAIEHLERGNHAIHISFNPILEVYSKEFYPNIEVLKIDENIFRYKLLKKGKIIKLGKNDNNIDYYLKNIK